MLLRSHRIMRRSDRVQINRLLMKYTKVYLDDSSQNLGATLMRKNFHSDEMDESKATKVFEELCKVDKHSTQVGDANYRRPKAEGEARFVISAATMY